MKVLVVYGTRHGATKGIAERIAETLRGEGLDVTLTSVQDARDVGLFDAYVIGSAAYMGHWIKEAAGFVRDHMELFARRPVWLFSSGPVGTDTVDKQGRDILVASEPSEFGEFDPAIHPRGEKVFFGAYDPDAPAMNFAESIGQRFFRLMPAAREALPAGDFRDWPAIEAWAREIATELQAVPAGR